MAAMVSAIAHSRSNIDFSYTPMTQEQYQGAARSNQSLYRSQNTPKQLPAPKVPDNWEGMQKFDYFMAIIIIVNVLQVGLEQQFKIGSPYFIKLQCAWFFLNLLFAICYVLEMGVKLSCGWLDRSDDGKAFLTRSGSEFFSRRSEDGHRTMHWWNIADFGLTILAIVQVYYSVAPPAAHKQQRLWCGACVETEKEGNQHQILGLMRMIRFIRILRLIKLMRNIPALMMVIDGVFNAIKSLVWVLVLQAIVVYAVAVFFCITIGDDAEYGEAFEGESGYFGNLGMSILTMLDIAILAEWDNIVRPVVHKRPELILVFVLFLLLTAFGMMNVMIGIIVDSTNQARKDLETDEKEAEMFKASGTWGSMIHDKSLRKEDIEKETDAAKREEMLTERTGLIRVILQKNY